MSKYQEIIGITELFSEAITGNGISAVQFLMKTKEIVSSIRDVMFYNKIDVFINELETKNTDKRKMGELLAKSDYKEEYGFVLLKYIDDFESTEKGKFLAYLLDALSKEFISVRDCFIYARLLKDISLSGLLFIKSNISNRVFKDDIIFKELQRYNLVYEANEGGYAFEYTAYYLDKYALSYCNEKYKYNGEKDYIPSREKFPAKVSAIAISQGEPY